MDPSAVRLNLSYVLHEPSGSRDVEMMARHLRAEGRVVQRAVARLAALHDDELAGRLILYAPGGTPEPHEPLLSVRVGAWRLLDRIVSLVPGDRGARRDGGAIQFVDDPDQASATEPTTLFRGPALLRRTSSMTEGAAPRWFVTTPLRPGLDSVLVRFQPLALEPESPGALDALAAAAPHIEAAIREFVGQWWCPVPLWRRPVEAVLPEFTER